MSKRFTYDKPLVAFSKGGINDNVTGETYEFTMDAVLDLLNELYEENQTLKLQVETKLFSRRELEKENEQSRKENNELKDKNSQLQETLAFRSNQLALMERLVDDLGSEEMERQMEEILND